MESEKDEQRSINKGISAASKDAKLELLPEITQLAEEILADAKKQSGEINRRPSHPVAHRTVKTPSTAKADVPPRFKAHSKRRTGQIVWLSLLGVVLTGMIVFFVYETAVILNIFGAVNYETNGLSFEDTELYVSESAIRIHVSHSDETKNILLVGCDIDENGLSRSDSMIILSLDHTHRKIKMTSLMRDMYLQIPSHGKHKLNAAYTYGGGELLLTTIYANFGIKIDRYVCVDYAAFAAAVDYIGGIEIEIEEMELEQFNKYVRGKENRIDCAGTYAMNGQQALSYCRIRKVGTDTARTARQREVLTKIMEKCRRMSPVSAENMMRVIAPSLTTNFTPGEMLQMMFEGLDCMDYSTVGMRIPVDGTWGDKTIDNIWYMEFDLNSNARSLNTFIYGDDETIAAMTSSLEEHDSQNDAWERSRYEKKKQRAAG